MEEKKTVTLDKLAEEKIDPRTYVTKTGRVRYDRLKPVTVWNNKDKGSYCIGKNEAKRQKRFIKNGK
jgi:hypothetical protein